MIGLLILSLFAIIITITIMIALIITSTVSVTTFIEANLFVVVIPKPLVPYSVSKLMILHPNLQSPPSNMIILLPFKV